MELLHLHFLEEHVKLVQRVVGVRADELRLESLPVHPVFEKESRDLALDLLGQIKPILEQQLDEVDA